MIADPEYPRLRLKTNSYSGVVQTFIIYADPPGIVFPSATALQIRSGGSPVKGAFFAYRIALRKLAELNNEWTVTIMGEKTLITMVHAMHLSTLRDIPIAVLVQNDDRFNTILNKVAVLQLTLDSISNLSFARN